MYGPGLGTIWVAPIVSERVPGHVHIWGISCFMKVKMKKLFQNITKNMHTEHIFNLADIPCQDL